MPANYGRFGALLLVFIFARAYYSHVEF